MAAELIVVPEAADDLAAAYAWYEAQRSGLGEEFLRCVDACVKAIARNPQMHGIVYQNYRRGLVRRFPYAVFYEEGDVVVTIYCVFHTSRDAEQWQSRLP
ncbi:MAG: type II toxin-antitoxin system RelE/ParE family toxin [Pirellulales bacterium]